MRRRSWQNENENEDEDEDEDEEEETCSNPGTKPTTTSTSTSYRSKHSQTEQRRRTKINHRFQILRELIPPNNQKRDKASLLLEVIEHIQVLQEKLQVYEGSFEQVWAQDPNKLMPWISNHGPIDNFSNHSQGMKNGSMDEGNAVLPMTSTPMSLESEFNGAFAYQGGDLLAGPTTPAVPFGVPLQSRGYTSGRNILPIENLVSQPHFSSVAEYPALRNEGRTYETSSTSVSNDYSQGILRKLTQALQNSGVDVSQANISVQLDVGRRDNNGSMAVTTDRVLYFRTRSIRWNALDGCPGIEKEGRFQRWLQGERSAHEIDIEAYGNSIRMHAANYRRMLVIIGLQLVSSGHTLSMEVRRNQYRLSRDSELWKTSKFSSLKVYLLFIVALFSQL